MNYEPLVTIIIPVYNGEKYVKYAIESALGQTYKNIEILVINDGSIDNSDAIIKPYTDRVRYIKKENGGVSSALNMALHEMKGVWLSWLSHDDMYLPSKIEKQVMRLNEILEENPDCNIEEYVLSCQDRRIDEKGQILPRGVSVHPEYTDKYDLVSKEICNYTIGGCTVLAAKSAYEKMGGFDEANRTISDADMWFKLMLSGYKFDFCNEQLVEARYHKDMVSVKRSGLVDIEKDNFYAESIKKIRDNVDNERLLSIAEAMKRAGLENAVCAATESYTGDRKTLNKALKRAVQKRNIKRVLRTVYRKIKWGFKA